MKKNFLKVAALLIAAMLMVVSCTQEVAPVDNGLVEATIGLAYGKDVIVDYGTEDNTAIIYKYELTALWDNLTNGAPIYGATNGEVLVYGKDNSGNPVTKKLSDSLGSFNPNYVTPGYWKIDVKGYIGSEVVLSGTTKAYFNGTKKSATVYVAPVSSTATGKLTVSLVMEDLDATDAGTDGTSKVYYYLDDNANTKVYLTKGDKVTADNEKNAAHNYTIEKEDVASGYHTITIKVDDYDGGVTKSFLMIPGNDVSVSGSIYPSQFINSQSTIKVVTLDQKNISIKAAGAENAVEFASDNVTPVSVTASSTFTASIANFDNIDGLTSNNITYTWYIDGVKQGTTGDPLNSQNQALVAPSVPGDYTVTCRAMAQYTDAAGISITVYGSEKYSGKIRVEASSNK